LLSSEEQPRTRNRNEEYLVSCGAGTALMTYILEIAGVEGSHPDFLGDTLRNEIPLFIERQALKGRTDRVYKISGDNCHSEMRRSRSFLP
jgi:hypothetical protein